MTKNHNENIIIAGVGLTAVGEHWEKSLRELALEAIVSATTDAGGIKPQAMYIGNMLAPALSKQSQLGALLADFAGMRGIEALAVEAGGASGGVALRQAFLALSSGLVSTALVVGVEKVTDRVSNEVLAAQMTSSDADYESVHGVTPTAQAAMLMRRYIFEYDVPRDAFAGFSVTAHANAVTNSNAMFRRAIKPDTYAKAGIVSDPINMFDAAPMADGAAAVILAREDVLPGKLSHPSIRIAASSITIGAVAIHDRPDPLVIEASKHSLDEVYRSSGYSAEDIDLFELHDIFSIYAVLSLEAGGFAKKGEGWKLALEGQIARTGSIPICTFGGSKARGDTGGATGLYQAGEATLQLQGRAGENQIHDAKVALVQCLGGTGATAASHILARVDTR
jgi:acetyl-CoA C-acetyltransferase